MDSIDQEDPQAGEILPPMLLEACWEALMDEHVKYETCAEDRAFKAGMIHCFEALQPHMQAALPYYEARIRDTRLGRADERLVMALAQYQELANYQRGERNV